MSSKDLKKRDQIDSKYKWNIEAMIPDESVIDDHLKQISEEGQRRYMAETREDIRIRPDET